MLTFPDALKPLGGAYAQSVKSVSGGQSLSGFEQVQSQMADRWSAAFSFRVRDAGSLLAMRAFLLAMRGRTNSVLLPAFDRARGPFIAAHSGSPLGTVVASPNWFNGLDVSGTALPYGASAQAGATVATPAWFRSIRRNGSRVPAAASAEVGSTLAAPAWYRSFAEMAGTPFFFAPAAAGAAAVTIVSAGTIRLDQPRAAVPEDTWIDILGRKRRLSAVRAEAGAVLARIDPAIDLTLAGDAVASPDGRSWLRPASGIGGTVTVTGAASIRIDGLASPVATGMHVTLLGQTRRLLSARTASGVTYATVDPGFALTPSGAAHPSADGNSWLLPATTAGGNVTVTSATTVGIAAVTGAVANGMWVTLLGADRRLSDVVPSGGGAYTASVSPAFSLAAVPRVSPAAHLGAAALLNATAVSIVMTAGAVPEPGQLFSIGTRLYGILSVSGEGPYAVGIWPWLRGDVANGAAVDFVAPACEMRFASDDEGADMLRTLDQLRFGTFTLRFDEVAF